MKCTSRRVGLAVFLLAAIIGCGNDPLAPFQPEVMSDVDTFELQATDVSNVTATLAFDWINSGFLANVDHSTQTAQGEARLVVRDPSGATVYDQVLVPSRNEQTQVGQSGVWTVTLILADYSGTLNFRLEKP